MMTDREILETAVDVLRSASVINKFTEVVWVSVERRSWDKFCGIYEEKDDEQTA
jgi:hypothetical protein